MKYSSYGIGYLLTCLVKPAQRHSTKRGCAITHTFASTNTSTPFLIPSSIDKYWLEYLELHYYSLKPYPPQWNTRLFACWCSVCCVWGDTWQLCLLLVEANTSIDVSCCSVSLCVWVCVCVCGWVGVAFNCKYWSSRVLSVLLFLPANQIEKEKV